MPTNHHRTLPLLLSIVLLWVVSSEGAPLPSHQNLEKTIEDFLSELYDQVYNNNNNNNKSGNTDIYDQMQGDQPNDNITNFRNMTDTEYFRTMRNRTKDNWIQALKENILRQMGRSNVTSSRLEETRPNSVNISSIIPNFLNATLADDSDHITEKIRSYYPSCDTPTTMDDEVWRDENVMNLYFNFDGNGDEKMNIATATLRLYRIPSGNLTKVAGKSPDCDPIEEDRLLRVSIYWYTRSLRKKKVKRRLSDSKVITENARWVELSVKPATRQWSKGRNLGLAVVVEDQEGNVLRPEKLFKGATCMVGASTPRPIPTIIIDAARQSNRLDGIHSLLGRNTTAAISGDIPLLPTVDICTLEFPENYSQPPPHMSTLRINACNLRKLHEHSQMSVERDRLERLVTLPEFLAPSPRHIRHQRQHLKNSNNNNNNNNNNQFDPRSKIINKRILTNEELQALNLNITTAIDR